MCLSIDELSEIWVKPWEMKGLQKILSTNHYAVLHICNKSDDLIDVIMLKNGNVTSSRPPLAISSVSLYPLNEIRQN